MRILVVDDSKAMRAIVRRALASLDRVAGATIVEAADGVEALAAVRADLPDLVLSDWNMPEMTGIELLQALNEAGITPIFGFVTSEATPEMHELARSHGARFVVSKPFTRHRSTELCPRCCDRASVSRSRRARRSATCCATSSDTPSRSVQVSRRRSIRGPRRTSPPTGSTTGRPRRWPSPTCGSRRRRPPRSAARRRRRPGPRSRRRERSSATCPSSCTRSSTSPPSCSTARRPRTSRWRSTPRARCRRRRSHGARDRPVGPPRLGRQHRRLRRGDVHHPRVTATVSRSANDRGTRSGAASGAGGHQRGDVPDGGGDDLRVERRPRAHGSRVATRRAECRRRPAVRRWRARRPSAGPTRGCRSRACPSGNPSPSHRSRWAPTAAATPGPAVKRSSSTPTATGKVRQTSSSSPFSSAGPRSPRRAGRRGRRRAGGRRAARARPHAGDQPRRRASSAESAADPLAVPDALGQQRLDLVEHADHDLEFGRGRHAEREVLGAEQQAGRRRRRPPRPHAARARAAPRRRWSTRDRRGRSPPQRQAAVAEASPRSSRALRPTPLDVVGAEATATSPNSPWPVL